MSQNPTASARASQASAGHTKILQASWTFIKAIARNTTIGNDTDQAQSHAMVEALKAHAAPQHDLLSWEDGSSHKKTLEEYLANEQTRYNYNLIKELSKRLKELDDLIAEEGLPNDIEELLRRHAKDYENEAKQFDGGLSNVSRLLWAIGNGAQVGWAVGIATTGPERALIPTELPQAWRTVFVCSQYLLSPTASNWQLLEITLQRSIMLLPNHIPYTLSFVMDIYGTPGYKWGSAGGALGLVAVVIAMKEQRGLRDRHTLNKFLENPNFENAIEMGNSQSTALQLKVFEIQEISLIIDDVVAQFERGNATDNQYARMGSAASTMFRSSKAVIEKRRAEKAPNPYRAKKYAIVGFGDTLIALVLWASSRNDAVLVTNLRWAAYYHYLLNSSAENHKHTPKQTFEIFSMAGAMMIFGVPLVSAVLLFEGPETFLDDQRLVNHTAAMMSLQSTIVHLVGPVVLGTPSFIRSVWGKVTSSPKAVNEQPSMHEDVIESIADILDMSEASLNALDSRPVQPDLSDLMAPFLDALNEYEQLAQDVAALGSTLKGKDKGGLDKQMVETEPSEYSRFVDLMSVLDINEDTDFLADRLGRSNFEFDHLKSFLGKIIR